MKSKTIICGAVAAVALQLGAYAASAQTAQPFPTAYLYSGSETNVTLNPGNYIITAYGASGGAAINDLNAAGYGAEMSAEFNFSTPTTLTLLVGGVGGFADTYFNNNGGGGGGGSFVVQGSTPLVVAGGGGGGAAFDESVYVRAFGGNATITTNGSAGGGDAGGAGGGGGGGGAGGDPSLTGFPNYGEGAGGGGGFYTDGESGRPVLGYVVPEVNYTGGGLSFEDGGAGGLADLGGGFFTGFANGAGGFGGGGGGYSDNSYAFGGGGGGYSGGGGAGASDASTLPGGGGGGGSYIDFSAVATLAEVSDTYGPDAPFNGEIIIANVAANIFQWQYINPSTPSLGKEISTTLCPGGAGATWVPSANLSGLDLTQAYLQGAYLSGANLVSTVLTNADLIKANLANANLSRATLTSADLTDANLEYSTLSGANLTNADLENASFYDSTLTNANLTNANLANADIESSTLTNANLTNADLRGAYTGGISTSGAILTNTINTDGSVNGLHLTAAAPLMTIHNYQARSGGGYTGAIAVSDEFALDPGTTLQMIFDGPQWNSLISFDAGIPVTLTGGNLDLEVDPSIDPSSLVGDSFQLFDFSNVTPVGQFTITTDLPPGEFQWDTSQLYSNGIVTLDAVPEPTSASLLAIGSLTLLRRRVRRSNVESAKLGN